MENLRSFILNVFSSLAAAGIIAFARNKGPWFMALVRALAIHKRISRWLINRAVLRLPVYARSRLQEEWLAHLNELGPFAALRHAISCTLRTPNLIRALNNETRPRNRIKPLTNFAGAVVTIVVCVLNAPGVYFESSLPPIAIQANQQSTHGSTVISSPTTTTLDLNAGIYKPLSSLTGTAVNLSDGIYKPLSSLTGTAVDLNGGVYNPLTPLSGTAVRP